MIGDIKWTLLQFGKIIPDENFICVLGTSHTWGQCEEGGRERIRDGEIWIDLLSEKLGIKVLNLSFPGNFNESILHQLCFLSKIDKFKNNCKMVLVEGRFMENNIPLDYHNIQWKSGKKFSVKDRFEKIRTSPNNPISNRCVPWMWNLHRGSRPDLIDHSLFTIGERAPCNFGSAFSFDRNVDYFIDRIQSYNALIEDISPTTINKKRAPELARYMGDIYQYYSYGQSHIQQDCIHYQSMIDLCNLMNIEFRWFCWDYYMHDPYFTNTEEMEFSIGEISKSYELFEKDIPTLRGGGTYAYVIDTEESPPDCDCSHQTEPFHKWISDKIFEELKDAF
jgi:hypothetical protein